MTDETSNHGERIAAVESDIRSLTTSVQQLASLVRESHESTARELRIVSTQISQIGRANWPTYIAGATLILTLGAAAMGPTWWRQAAVETKVNELTEKMNTHSLLPVHPVAAKDLQNIERRIEHLEKKVNP